MITDLEETKAYLKRRCIANCGHNANESCICKINQCFKEIEKAQELESKLQRWYDLLSMDGINSKQAVKEEIYNLINIINNNINNTSKDIDILEEIRKAIVVMPKIPPIIVKNGKVTGIKLNSAMIEELSKPSYSKTNDDENHLTYLMGVRVYRDDKVSRPIYIIEGEIETELNKQKIKNDLK